MYVPLSRAARAISITALALGMIFTGPSGSYAAPIGGQCTVNTIAYKQNDAYFSTISTNSVNIPGMAINFTLAAPGCVVVEYTANASNSSPNEASYVTFDLNSNQSGKTILFGTRIATADADLLTAKEIFTNLPAGSHTIRMKLKSNDGTQVTVAKQFFLLHYRK